MADLYASHSGGLNSPSAFGAAITPNDSADLATTSRGIWVGGAGDLHVTLAGGSEITLVGVLAGTLLPLRAARVHATGTTASSLVALW